VPALLSSLIKAPAGDLAGALAASDDRSRACLREWQAPVPDHRSVMGRWHPLEFVLALAICAFTAAGHDSPTAIAEWAAGCCQATLAVLGGRQDPWTRRIRPPSARTFGRVFTGLDAEAFNADLYGWLAQLGLFFSELKMRAKAATADHAPRLQAGPARVPDTKTQGSTQTGTGEQPARMPRPGVGGPGKFPPRGETFPGRGRDS